MRTLLEAEGVTPTLLHATAAGEVPVKVVASTEREHRDLRSIPSGPRARRAE